MTHRFLKNGRRTIRFTVSILLTFSVCHSHAQDFFAGMRAGAYLDGDDGRFHQAEAFGGVFLRRWHFYSNWFLRPGADASVGWISDNSASGFIASAGPLVELGKGRFPLTVEVGAAPTALTRHHFPTRNFGDNFEFTSHAGLNWRFTDHVTAGLRVQHMSNAGFTHLNPGINMEMLTLRFEF